MRPRLFSGERAARALGQLIRRGASMRPRLFSGERRRRAGRGQAVAGGFNEAPLIQRGKVAQIDRVIGAIDASMRPRLFSGERWPGAACG